MLILPGESGQDFLYCDKYEVRQLSCPIFLTALIDTYQIMENISTPGVGSHIHDTIFYTRFMGIVANLSCFSSKIGVAAAAVTIDFSPQYD
ncbi:hypothetical protein ACGVWS_02210 [Enterobacteriaceae bacterium LUAb1]